MARRSPLPLDAAVVCALGAGAWGIVRAYDLPPLPGMAPLFGTPWSDWSRLPFWLSLLAFIAWLTPLYLQLTRRGWNWPKDDNVSMWTFFMALLLMLPCAVLWLDGRFGYAEAGDGVIELQQTWPVRRRFRTEELRAVNAVRNSGYNKEEKRHWASWWVEVETEDGRVFESDFLEPQDVPALAARLSSLRDVPIRWVEESEHRGRRASTPEAVQRGRP